MQRQGRERHAFAMSTLTESMGVVCGDDSSLKVDT